MLIKPFNDSGTIWFSVADIVENGSISKNIDEFTSCAWSTHTSNHDYFLVYPNSRFMVAFLLPFGYFLQNILGIDLRTGSAYYGLVIINSAMMTSAIFFTAMAARKEKGDFAALIVFAISAVFLPYYINVYKLYSDTMSMPFVALSLWLMIEADHAEKNRLVFRAFSGITMGIGVLLKGSVWVLVVAAAIYLAVRAKNIRYALRELAALLLPVLALTQLWSIRSDSLPWLDTSEAERYELPAVHWVMMASYGDGGFSQADVDYSLSFDTVEERSEAARETYVYRVKEHGLSGYIKFLINKISNTFSDGAYSQKAHLMYFSNYIVGELVSPTGMFHGRMMAYVSSILCFMYISILSSALLNAWRDKGASLLMNVCMFGLILFFCLWEAKSRYLLNYTVMFILMTALTVDSLAEHLNKLRNVGKI